MFDKIEKSDAEWRAQLTPEQYQVTRHHGTERAFTGTLNKVYEDGMYHCICCDAELFSSTTKYDSGSGWPSFYDTLGNGAIAENYRSPISQLQTRQLLRIALDDR